MNADEFAAFALGVFLGAVGAICAAFAIADSENYGCPKRWRLRHDWFEYAKETGRGPLPLNITAFRQCRRCATVQRVLRYETPDEFESRTKAAS